MRAKLLTVTFMAALGALACGGDDQGAVCLDELPLDCQPAYQPTFENVFDNRLGMTCGASTTGGSCHSEQGAMGGLVLQNADDAHDALLGSAVLPGDPECSPLIRRIESDDPNFMMPPGNKLSAAERCAIRQWVAQGAKR
jgi:Planctomycete cytochrome C